MRPTTRHELIETSCAVSQLRGVFFPRTRLENWKTYYAEWRKSLLLPARGNDEHDQVCFVRVCVRVSVGGQ